MDAISALTYYAKLIWAYLTHYLLRLADIYRDFPYEIQVAVGFILMSAVLILFFTAAIWRRRRQLRKQQKRRRRLTRQYGEAIERAFSASPSEVLTREELLGLFRRRKLTTDPRELLRNKHERRQFCQMVYERLTADTSCEKSHANLHCLLNLFGIPAFLEEEVSLGPMHYKMHAMDMARTFKLSVSLWVVNKLMRDKRPHVRRQALYAAIASSSDSDLSYFETAFFDTHSCMKDEIELGYVLHRRQQNGLKLPNLAHWASIQRDDETRQIFVRLMRRFGQRSTCGQLEVLFKGTNNKRLMEEICRTWGHLRYEECEPLLGDILITQPDETKVVILHALTRLNTGRSLQLLLDGYENTTSPHVRFEALRCIYNYGTVGRDLFHRMETSAKQEEDQQLHLDAGETYQPAADTLFNQAC